MKKKILKALVLTMTIASLTGCSKAPEDLSDDVVQADIENYINKLIDEDAKVDYLQESDSVEEDGELVVTYDVSYKSEVAKYTDQFIVTYVAEDGEWEFSKCKVNEDYSKKNKESLVEEVKEEETKEEVKEETKEETKEEVKEETKEPKTKEEETKEETQVANKANAVSDDIYDYTFELNGVVYQLPCLYSELAANGNWTIDSYKDLTEESEVDSGESEYFSIKNDIASIDIYVKNVSLDTKPIKDCVITSIEVQAGDNVDFTIAKGIKCTSKPEEVKAAFGDPTSSSSDSDSERLDYEEDYNIETCFYFDKDSPKYNSITIECVKEVDMNAEVSDEIPEYLSQYKAPSAITDNVKDTIFEVDGVVYQLPCPVSEFTKNGWEFEKDEDFKVVGAGDKEYLSASLVKGDFTLDLELTNFSKNATTPENCAITTINFSRYNLKGTSDDFAKFSGGLGLRSSLDDLKAVCSGEDFSTNDGSYGTSFRYTSPDYTKGVKYSIDNENSFVDVTVENNSWEY